MKNQRAEIQITLIAMLVSVTFFGYALDPFASVEELPKHSGKDHVSLQIPKSSIHFLRDEGEASQRSMKAASETVGTFYRSFGEELSRQLSPLAKLAPIASMNRGSEGDPTTVLVALTPEEHADVGEAIQANQILILYTHNQ